MNYSIPSIIVVALAILFVVMRKPRVALVQDNGIDWNHKATRATGETGETISAKISGGKFDVSVRDSGLTTVTFYPDEGGVILLSTEDDRLKFVPNTGTKTERISGTVENKSNIPKEGKT